MPDLTAARRWLIPLVVVVVLAIAAGAGWLLRESAAEAEAGDPTPTVTPTSQARPGDPAVQLGPDAAQHPAGGEVRALLQRYSDAIGTNDYESWQTTVVSSWSSQLSESVWLERYGSTRYGNVMIHRIEPTAGGGLLVMLSFTSVQDPASAPSDLVTDCINWRVSYPLEREQGQLRIGIPAERATLRQACAAG